MNILGPEFQEELRNKLKIEPGNLQTALYDNLSKQHFYFQLLIECKTSMKDVVEKMKGAIEGAKALNDLETSDSRTQIRRTQKTGSASVSSSSGNFKMFEDESDSWRKGA